MLVKVKGGKVIGVQGNPDHPFTQGRLCTKTNRYEERVYHPDRILYPMRRSGPKGSGQFERISWDEALETISGTWRRIIDAQGPTSILPYSYLGTQGLVNGLTVGDPFFNKLGATVSERTFCDSAACTGYIMTVGPTPGMDPESFQHSKFIILWACNMLSTNAHMWPFIAKAQKNGAKVVVIDPVRTAAAQQADQHIRIRPGTDAAKTCSTRTTWPGTRWASTTWPRMSSSTRPSSRPMPPACRPRSSASWRANTPPPSPPPFASAWRSSALPVAASSCVR
jgi:anaerobic selenocysteine-containing dehydrogenase